MLHGGQNRYDDRAGLQLYGERTLQSRTTKRRGILTCEMCKGDSEDSLSVGASNAIGNKMTARHTPSGTFVDLTIIAAVVAD